MKCNNGSEIFHWNVLRNDTPLRRNPFQFFSLLQRINQKTALEICQWSHTRQSRKQQLVEQAHIKMLDEFEAEIKHFGMQIACNNFFNKTMFITKTSSQFFQKLQLSSATSENLTENDINFTDLYIQDKQINKTSTQQRPSEPYQAFLVTFPSRIRSFVTKTVKITNRNPVIVRKAKTDLPPVAQQLILQ